MKVLLINGSPRTKRYWNIVYGLHPGEVSQDAEGLQTMRTLGKNMAWILKNLKSNTEPVPKAEEWEPTNFIR